MTQFEKSLKVQEVAERLEDVMKNNEDIISWDGKIVNEIIRIFLEEGITVQYRKGNRLSDIKICLDYGVLGSLKVGDFGLYHIENYKYAIYTDAFHFQQDTYRNTQGRLRAGIRNCAELVVTVLEDRKNLMNKYGAPWYGRSMREKHEADVKKGRRHHFKSGKTLDPRELRKK